ncbi:hypothetical protein LTR53_015420 [Teratosphaeriaceae sp. CCFEE 6253]|nr:hypothetical protein LTR53_015420 [Teratosphaeriaceae sp. CCFEE 6253]
MDDVATSPPRKKRRIPKACSACRRSKVRCDEKRPCTRCVQSATTCTWHEKLEVSVDERLERVEHAVWALILPTGTSAGTDALAQRKASVESCGACQTREPLCRDVVSSGSVSEGEAEAWFATFFRGCDRFVPIFDPKLDSYASVRRRDSILFDVLVIYGCRAATGSLSQAYQILYHLIRQHTSDLILQDSVYSLERVQALLVIASYSDSGAVLCDISLRESKRMGLPSRLSTLLSTLAGNIGSPSQTGDHDLTLFTSARTWYGLFVLDQILSLDGGKPPSMSLHASSRRVCALIAHPCRTPLDLRLFAQVELNEIRASSYASLRLAATAGEQTLKEAIDGGLLDLSMWHTEWQVIVNENLPAGEDITVFVVNISIQHAWAVLTLQLRALTASGVENIALMTEPQRLIASAAKAAAERHLDLLLTSVHAVSSPDAPTQQPPSDRPYIASFRYAMEFVWAKNAFCVLIVLRLAFLLGDALPAITQRLQQARDFLAELSKVGMGANSSYTRILSQTIRKCQRAVDASMQAQDITQPQRDPGDEDFSTFVPQEFLFEWSFPGLNLCYIPLDWQDLFLDFGATE